MWSSRSRHERGSFGKVKRDAVLLVGGLAGFCALSVLVGNVLPRTITFPAPPRATSAAKTGTGSPTPRASAEPLGDTVAHPWAPGRPMLGINVFWAANPSEREAVTRAKIKATVHNVVGLGANWIAVSFPFVTGGVTSTRLSADSSLTPDLSDLQTMVTTAKSAGLRITLRPLLDERSLAAHDPTAWRGVIRPAVPSAWFANYQKFLTPYLELAQRTHVDAFNVSTELSSMEDDTAQWSSLIGHVRKAYTGRLFDSINYDRIKADTPRIPTAAVGVDAYFPLADASDDASVSQLEAGWNKWLDGYGRGSLGQLTLSEVGIVSQDGAYKAPFAWESSGVYDPKIQVRWDTAACAVAKQRHVAGIFWWYVNLDLTTLPGSPHAQRDPMDVLDSPGTEVIKSCFADFTSGG